jgi:hypothetical protein
MAVLWKHPRSIIIGPMLDGSGVLAAPRLATRRRRDDPRIQALVGLAAVLAMIAGASLVASRAAPDPGPLAVGETGSGLSFGPVLRGQWAVTTLFTNRLQGDSPAVIDSVSPATPGLAPGVVFRYGMLTRNHGGWGFGRGWPPSSAPILPLRAGVVRPGQPAAILVGVASRRFGYWRVRAFTVRYHVGSAHYQATFAEGIAIRVTPRCPSCAERNELAGRLR